ncbi:MAG TPA: hypothetical protein VMZ06_10270 [Candidatus Bathyarchaeia archaeon]|nr:hypothetical protein [Candidatus Bathyarchaeia archaeon]
MVLLVAILTAILGAGCGAKPQPVAEPGEKASAGPAADPAELFKQSCSACHRIEKAVAYSGKTPWKELVDRMIQHGAKITPENAALIVKHLETAYPQKKPTTL